MAIAGSIEVGIRHRRWLLKLALWSVVAGVRLANFCLRHTFHLRIGRRRWQRLEAAPQIMVTFSLKDAA